MFGVTEQFLFTQLKDCWSSGHSWCPHKIRV